MENPHCVGRSTCRTQKSMATLVKNREAVYNNSFQQPYTCLFGCTASMLHYSTKAKLAKAKLEFLMTFMPAFIQSTANYPRQDQAKHEADLLRERCRQNLSDLLAGSDIEVSESTCRARLEAELQIIEDKGFCGYFLIVADFVQWAKTSDIATGPGRGSGPCSLVGYTLGITSIDPTKYNLPFERFINPDRDVLPDFDLDFCDSRRDEVTSYIQSKYGFDRVAQLSANDNTPLPSRLVICDRPLAGLIPIYLNPQSGFPFINITTEQTEGAGLVQFNAINQKALTIIQHTVRRLAESGTAIEIDNIPLDDNSTFQLLSAGEVSNIAELDGKNYKFALEAVQPATFSDLYAVIALCYPYLQGHIALFAERKKNPELIRYFHPSLESITAETYGLILYQEQVMQIAHEIAGFSFAQSDLLRRALRQPESVAAHTYKSEFINGSIESGMPQSEAEGLFEYIAISGRCSFNKSHAIAYAKIAYQIAWLNAHYPCEYLYAKSRLSH